MPNSLEILLVEASREARYRLRLQLQRLGATVRTAESAEQAMTMLQQRSPDVVVSANILPGMNGLEMLELVRLRADGPRPPIILVTPDNAWPLRRHALHRGAAAVIPRSGIDAELPRVLKGYERVPATPDPLVSTAPITASLARPFRPAGRSFIGRLIDAARSGRRQAVPLAVGMAFGSIGVAMLSLLVWG